MCTFTPSLFPNCNCLQVTTGALALCVAATRTGDQCPKPQQNLLQKRPGTCGLCKQAQVAKVKADNEAAAISGKVEDVEVAKPAAKGSGGKVKWKGKKKSGSGKAAAEAGVGKRVTRGGAKATTTLPSR